MGQDVSMGPTYLTKGGRDAMLTSARDDKTRVDWEAHNSFLGQSASYLLRLTHGALAPFQGPGIPYGALRPRPKQ